MSRSRTERRISEHYRGLKRQRERIQRSQKLGYDVEPGKLAEITAETIEKVNRERAIRKFIVAKNSFTLNA